MKQALPALTITLVLASCSKGNDSSVTVLTTEEQPLVKVWYLKKERLITSGSVNQDTIYNQFPYGPTLSLFAELSPAAGNTYPLTASYPSNAKKAIDKFSFWGGVEMRRGAEELTTYWRIDSAGALQTSQGRYYFKLSNQSLVIAPVGLTDTLWFE